jgi:hypothetical protein
MSKTSHYHTVVIVVETEKPMKNVGDEMARRICMHADVHDATVMTEHAYTAEQWKKLTEFNKQVEQTKRSYIGQKDD